MTTIASMGQFEGLALGSLVTVGDNNTWEKVEEGWRRGDFTLESSHFQGDVTSGRVILGVRKQPGQVWTDEGAPNWGYSYLLLQEVDGAWWHARMIDGAFQNITSRTTIPGRLMTDAPAWARPMTTLGQTYVAMLQDRDRYRQALSQEQVERANANQALATVRSGVQTALHDLVRENEKLRERVDAILQAGGMRRTDQMVKVTSRVRVHRYLDITVEDLATVLAARGVEDARPREPLRVVTNYETDMVMEVEGEPGVCACRLVGRPQLRNRLRETLGGDFYDFNQLSVTCENHEQAAAEAPPAF